MAQTTKPIKSKLLSLEREAGLTELEIFKQPLPAASTLMKQINNNTEKTLKNANIPTGSSQSSLYLTEKQVDLREGFHYLPPLDNDENDENDDSPHNSFSGNSSP